MIAPRADHGIRKALLARVFIDHAQRPQQPLRVAVQLDDLVALRPAPTALERLRLALLLMDRPASARGLRSPSARAAIQQLLVHVLRRRGQEDHHRAFDRVLVRHQLAALRVFAGRGDLQPAFATATASAHRRRVRAPCCSAMARILCLRSVSPM